MLTIDLCASGKRYRLRDGRVLTFTCADKADKVTSYACTGSAHPPELCGEEIRCSCSCHAPKLDFALADTSHVLPPVADPQRRTTMISIAAALTKLFPDLSDRIKTLVDLADKADESVGSDLCWLEDVNAAWRDPEEWTGSLGWQDANWCESCVDGAASAARKVADADVTIAHGYGTAECDSVPFCAKCGARLMYSPTDECIRSELQHFADNSVSTPVAAWELLDTVERAGLRHVDRRLLRNALAAVTLA